MSCSDESFTHQLSADDARIIDWFMEHGFTAEAIERLPESDRARATAVLSQMSVLDACVVEEPHESLTDAVLARIDRHEAERAAAMRLPQEIRPRRGVRFADFVGVAALLMLSTAVLLPIISQVRAKNLQTVCANNLRSVGGGLSAYAAANAGTMPAMAGFGAFGDWGKYRHSDNLGKLATDGYCPVHALNCPGCARGAACFAYRVPAENTKFMLDTPTRMVVAADANPVIDVRIDGRMLKSGMLSSRNHSESGQNLLFGDCAVEWHVSPLLKSGQAAPQDNIWLPRGSDGVEQADLKCQPTSPVDNFLAQ